MNNLYLQQWPENEELDNAVFTLDQEGLHPFEGTFFYNDLFFQGAYGTEEEYRALSRRVIELRMKRAGDQLSRLQEEIVELQAQRDRLDGPVVQAQPNLGYWEDGTPVQSGRDALNFQMSPSGKRV